MTRRKTLVLALSLVVTLALAGGAWAAASNSGNDPWRQGMPGPAAGYGSMMGSGPGGYGGPSGSGPGGSGSMMGSGPGGYGGGGFGTGRFGGGMMRGGSFGIEGTGEVSTLAEARVAAQRYADAIDLTVGEVMEFRDNFYAELLTASGEKATEVLVDPGSGAVRIEYGPAMMWNTAYGMHPQTAKPTVRVSAEQARQIADRWLAEHQRGTTAGEADAFPGYYTLHTVTDHEVTGMLSVNAVTGAVWYHGWHGNFVAMTE